MRPRVVLFALALTFSQFSGPARAEAPPPPPPPPPPAPTRFTQGASPIVFTDAVGDTVMVCPDTLVQDRSFTPSQVSCRAVAPSFHLASGESLTVTDRVAMGRYPLRDGGELNITSDGGYPRAYQVEGSGPLCCRFSAWSARGVAVLVQRRERPDTSIVQARGANGVEQLQAAHQTSFPNWLHETIPIQTVILPASWYASAEIPLPRGWSGMTLSFFSYGPSARARIGRELVTHYGTVEVAPKTVRLSAEERLLDAPTPDVLAEATLLGSIWIERSTRARRFRVLP